MSKQHLLPPKSFLVSSSEQPCLLGIYATYNYTYNVRTYRTNNCFDSGVALLQGAGPGLPNMDFLLEDFGHRLVPRKCISVGRSFSLWAPAET